MLDHDRQASCGEIVVLAWLLRIMLTNTRKNGRTAPTAVRPASDL